MSAFDDEFGLFGDDDEKPDEEERRPTLGARQIATGETIIDEIEPEDERPARRRPGSGSLSRDRTSVGGDRRPPYRDRDHGPRTTGDPAVAQARAVELLRFLAQKLVSKPDEVIVAVVEGSRGPVIELEVHPDDFGKVIGKGGRVAQALRTIVRASAEGKVSIDIVDVEDDDADEPSASAAPSVTVDDDDVRAAADTGDDDADDDAVAAVEPEAPSAPARKTTAAKKKAPAKKTTAKRAAAAPAKRKKPS